MTTATFRHIDPTTFGVGADSKPWTKVDDGGKSYEEVDLLRDVYNARGHESEFAVDQNGFGLFHSPAKEKLFTDDANVRSSYYPEVESLVKEKLPGVKKVVIFDHTIRRKQKGSPRQPVQQVHVDQTPKAAETRVFRHLPKEEAAELVKGRYQIVNVWRPIENPASDFPLAVVDWRTTEPKDLIPVDLLYPVRDENDDGDDRGKEKYVERRVSKSKEGYEVKGETFAVQPNDKHRFVYWKDMTPDEVLFLKCFDSRGQDVPQGKQGIASYTPHTAFIDPQTPKDAPGRQSIEVRCLVFYE